MVDRRAEPLGLGAEMAGTPVDEQRAWAAAMRDLKAHGLDEPRLVIGDCALGTWAALRDVYPHARRQACWVHAIANVLDALPKRPQPRHFDFPAEHS